MGKKGRKKKSKRGRTTAPKKRFSGVHASYLDELAERLSQKSWAEIVEKRVLYGGRYQGELDIAVYRGHGKGRRMIYYEIKSNDTKSAWAKAKQQFNRCEKAFPGVYDYVYWTPQRVTHYKVE